MVEIGSLATSPAVETGIAEALKIEIQDSTWRGTPAALIHTGRRVNTLY